MLLNSFSARSLSRKIAKLLVGISFFIGSVYSQAYTYQRELGTKDGLLENNVRDVVQDDEGFVYFATHSGISRFDGFDFLNFKGSSTRTEDRPFGKLVNTIVKLYKNYLLLGTNKGVSLYNCTTRKFQCLAETAMLEGQPDNPVIALYPDSRRRRLWIGTEDGLLKMDSFRGIPKSVAFNDTTIEKRIYQIVPDGNKLWIGKGDGLWEFDPNTERYAQTPVKGTEGERVVAILQDPLRKRIWAGTKTGRLLCYADGCWSIVASLKHGINTIALGGDYLWIGTTKNLVRYNVGDLLAGSGKGTIIDGTVGINRLYTSPIDGAVWVGAYAQGVRLIDPKFDNEFVVQNYDKSDVNALSSGMIWSINQSRDSTIWLGLNRQGLDAVKQGKRGVQHFNGIDGPMLPDGMKTVFSVTEDSNGNLWAGTISGGLFLCHRDSQGDIIKFEKMDQGLLNRRQITALCDPGDGRLWIAALGEGLFYLDFASREIRQYSPPSHIHAENLKEAFSLYHNSRDRRHLWLGTKNGGFFCIDLENNSNTTNYFQGSQPLDSMLTDNCINAFFQDREDSNVLWLGTGNSGILQFDKKLGKVINSFNDQETKDFPDNQIYGLKQDSKGNLWFSTNFGIAELDPKKKRIVRCFTEEDGLGSREFNDGAHFMNEKTGDIFFGSTDGYCMINILVTPNF